MASQPLKEFSNRVYRLRVRRNVSPVEIARACRCAPFSVFDEEAGTSMPAPRQLLRLARLCRLSVAELLEGEE